MPSTVRPRGPLPARVYWTRRVVVLAVPLLLVVVLARVLGGSSDGKDTSTGTAAQAGATVDEAPATSAPTTGGTEAEKVRKGKGKKRRPQETAPPEPVLAEPTGPCTESDILATPHLATAAGGSDVPMQINLRTKVAEACTWQASAQTMTVTVTSGDDYIWSTRECPMAIPPQDVVVRQAVDAPVVVTWSAKRSDETCSDRTAYAMPGFYHVAAAALGGDATDVQFELVAPQPAVITKTAEPQQQGGKGKKRDTAHTPGEDGAGNSAG
jgi:hypothetical protein